jgi:hypothetical protein
VHVVEGGEHLEQLDQAQLGIETGRLQLDADPALDVPGIVLDVQAIDLDAARGGLL